MEFADLSDIEQAGLGDGCVSGKKGSQHDSHIIKRFDDNLMNSFSGMKKRESKFGVEQGCVASNSNYVRFEKLLQLQSGMDDYLVKNLDWMQIWLFTNAFLFFQAFKNSLAIEIILRHFMKCLKMWNLPNSLYEESTMLLLTLLKYSKIKEKSQIDLGYKYRRNCFKD